MKFHAYPLSIILFTLPAACTSLKPVTELTTKSTTTLALFEELPVTYTGFCEERCQFTLARKNQVVRDSAINCDCKVFVQADRSTNQVYKALLSYFKNLGELSNGNLATVNTKALNEALTEGQFATLTIDKKTVTAYGALAKVVINAFTEGYRKTKLKSFIESANPSVQSLIPVLQASVSNLESELDFQKERSYVLHNELLMEKLTGYERVKISRDYYHELNRLNEQQLRLRTFSKSLTTVAKGHQKIFDNRSKLTGKEIGEALAEYAAVLQDLIIDFRKL